MKKISVNTVRAFLKENKKTDDIVVPFPVGDTKFDVRVKTHLSTAEKAVFVNRVLSGCFDAAGNLRPEYVNPMIGATFMQLCTDVPVLSIKTDKDGGDILDIDAMNDLYDAMYPEFFDDKEFRLLMDELNDLCARAVEWKLECSLSDRGVDAALSRLLAILTEKVEGLDLKELMQYAGRLSAATQGMSEGDIVGKLIEMGNKIEV